MTTFWRTFHLLNIGVQFVGVVVFAYAYSRLPASVFLWFLGLCCLQGALSFGWVKAAQTAKGNTSGR